MKTKKNINSKNKKTLKSKNKPTKSIGIFGAGISGLWLANLIKKNHPNTEVIIYEKTDKIGGRFVFENGFFLGAEMMHFKSTYFYNYVMDLLARNKISDINSMLVKLNHPKLFCDELKKSNLNYNVSINHLNSLSDKEKIVLVCHDFCMNLKDIDQNALLHEAHTVDESFGGINHIIKKKLHKLIMKDLVRKDVEIICSYNKSQVKNHDLIVYTYPPKKFKEKNYSAMKIFFKSKKLSKVMERTDDFYYCEKNKYGIDVCELWRNEDYFVIFSTADRSKKLNSLTEKELAEFIQHVIERIFELKIKIKIAYKKYWDYGYHYPCSKNKQIFKETEYSCGEWISKNYDATLSGAMFTARELFNKLVLEGHFK
jgi:hypothetical protein